MASCPPTARPVSPLQPESTVAQSLPNQTFTSPTGPHSLWLLSLLTLLLGTTFLVYTTGLDEPFVLDDGVNIPDAALQELT